MLIAECNFTKKTFLLQTFSNKSSKIDYQWNITTTHSARPHRLVSAKIYTTPLKFGTSARMLIIVMLKRSMHNSLHSRFFLVFCLSFFLKGRHFLMLHRTFFYQIEKQEEITLYLPGPTLFVSFVCCNVMHDLSRKVFCNILIQKFQNYTPRTGCLARYISLF